MFIENTCSCTYKYIYIKIATHLFDLNLRKYSQTFRKKKTKTIALVYLDYLNRNRFIGLYIQIKCA